MAFHTADYDAYVVLGDPAATPLWQWNAWQQFLPAIDPLIKAARGKPAVRSTQIQDLALCGLFKPGPRHDGEFGFHLLADKWEPLSAEDTAPTSF